MSDSTLIKILEKLITSPESQHIEFKENNSDATMIGKNISAISNALILDGIQRGYIIWGISDQIDKSGKHIVTGTTFSPGNKKVGNQELLIWLNREIKPEPQLEIRQLNFHKKNVVVAIIRRNATTLTTFRNEVYIRKGSSTTKMTPNSASMRNLWAKILSEDFETQHAKTNLSIAEVYSLIDLAKYHEMRRLNGVFSDETTVFDTALQNNLVTDNGDGTYDITNLGAIMLAKDLNQFLDLKRCAARVVVYNGRSKMDSQDNYIGNKGYAIGFEGLVGFVLSRIKDNEIIGPSVRTNNYYYPASTIRELTANLLIHQDFSVTGVQPTIEIYSDRIKFINAGEPVVDKNKFVNSANSRNRKLADELSLMGICERRGLGWDKIVSEANSNIMPTPSIEVIDATTQVSLYKERGLNSMTEEQVIWTVYTTACLLHEQDKCLTNADIRRCFGIDDKNSAIASRILSKACNNGAIRIFDEQSGPKNRKYIPSWVK